MMQQDGAYRALECLLYCKVYCFEVPNRTLRALCNIIADGMQPRHTWCNIENHIVTVDSLNHEVFMHLNHPK